ncbi:ChrR family anti-sigma-E factor [Kaistia terrae]|uniref:ChrR family anti-sigma-E factor n=1 Tax=Kaistia terrae TaxID=537017 RepID=A0ABW0PVP5_9HYPH|nr:ChrR family anti-sigma-E factor [Kaistia terrae]MCX5579426.1 ChrR family anti-sigma-E factor [Kaistia terrae]
MTIRHHLSDDLLVSYAAGSLAEGWSLAVATHLALCPACRKRLALAEGIGGELLEATEVSPETDSSWEAMRRRIAQSPPRPVETPRGAPVARRYDGLPEPLRSYVGGDIETLRWRSLGRGASQIRIQTADTETQVRLLRIPAGKPVPEHSHGGRELTLVLSGSFADGKDLFARGDIEDADASLTHTPTATPGEDCICLAVTDAPLRFRSWFVRAIQPILGI